MSQTLRLDQSDDLYLALLFDDELLHKSVQTIFTVIIRFSTNYLKINKIRLIRRIFLHEVNLVKKSVTLSHEQRY